jgi:hypothetical protein
MNFLETLGEILRISSVHDTGIDPSPDCSGLCFSTDTLGLVHRPAFGAFFMLRSLAL